MPEPRYVTPAPVPARSEAETQSTTGDGPFRLYRLCPCFRCSGFGKLYAGGIPGHKTERWERCKECRGEGKVLDLVATANTPADLGQAIVTLGSEGEFDDCPMGVMHREEGQKGRWLVLPWLASPRNVSDAGRVLAKSKHANR